MPRSSIGIIFAFIFSALATPNANAQYCVADLLLPNLSFNGYVRVCGTNFSQKYNIERPQMSFRHYLQVQYKSYLRSARVRNWVPFAPGGCRDGDPSPYPCVVMSTDNKGNPVYRKWVCIRGNWSPTKSLSC